MAWIYLAGSQVSPSDYKSLSVPLPIVKKSDGHRPASSRECTQATSRKPQSGTMLPRSTARNSKAKLTLSMAASPARILAARATAQAWQESAQDFSMRLSASHARFVRNLSSLRTCQPLELEDFSKSCEHLPIFGMTVGGRVYLPQKLEPHILGSDGSCSLPTPTAHHYGTSNNGKRADGSTFKQAGKLSLNSMARTGLWPTPTVNDSKGNACPSNLRRHTINLGALVQLFPTPTATMIGGGRDSPTSNHDTTKKFRENHGILVGQLNPMWVEWLMGYRLGWTELEDWATQLSRSKSELLSCASSGLKKKKVQHETP